MTDIGSRAYRNASERSKTAIQGDNQVLPETSTTPASPAAKERSFAPWLWFAVGFVLVFGALCFRQMTYFDGQAVHATKLWRYYWLEIQDAWNSSGNLGLKTGSTRHAIEVAMQHVLFAAVGGFLMMGGAWFVRSKSAVVLLK